MESDQYLIRITNSFPRRGHESPNTFRGILTGSYGTQHPVLLKSPDIPACNVPEDFTPISFYCHIWQEFQRVGINVVPWLLEDTNHVIVPDMECDNYRFYGKSRSLAIYDKNLTLPPFCNQDFLFLLVFADMNPQLVNMLSELTSTATENGIALPYDDPAELMIHPDGYFDLITLDLSRARLKVRIDEAYKTNQESTARLYRHWQRIYDFYIDVFERNPGVFS